MLPQRLVYVRDIGDADVPYWTAASPDGRQLLLEAGESVVRICYCRVAQLSNQGALAAPKPSQVLPTAWELPLSATVLTDRRIAFLTTQFDQGGGWSGFGLAGMTVAAAANAVSRSRAAKRSAGKVAIGQVRHEWLTSIGLRYRKPVFGLDTYIQLAAPTVAGPAVIELYKPKVIDDDLARLIVATVAAHRRALLRPDHGQQAMLTDYLASGEGAVAGANPGDLRWPLPGGTDELIASVIAHAAPHNAPRPTE